MYRIVKVENIFAEVDLCNEDDCMILKLIT